MEPIRHLAAAVFAAVVLACPPVVAQTGAAQVGAVTIRDAWVRAPATPNGAGAAYMAIAIAEGDDRLIAASTDAARRVELHTHQVDAAGVARMRQIDAIPVTADAPAVLAPGGLHVMLMGVTRPLVPGETLALTLTFAQAGEVVVSAPIRPLGAAGGHGATGGHGGAGHGVGHGGVQGGGHGGSHGGGHGGNHGATTQRGN
jgi:copper(I)-binding protein